MKKNKSLGKVKDVITSEHFGSIIELFSERFGYGVYLLVKGNYEKWCKRALFVQLPEAGLYYWDSMKNDDVLKIDDFPLDFHDIYKKQERWKKEKYNEKM